MNHVYKVVVPTDEPGVWESCVVSNKSKLCVKYEMGAEVSAPPNTIGLLVFDNVTSAKQFGRDNIAGKLSDGFVILACITEEEPQSLIRVIAPEKIEDFYLDFQNYNINPKYALRLPDMYKVPTRLVEEYDEFTILSPAGTYTVNKLKPVGLVTFKEV